MLLDTVNDREGGDLLESCTQGRRQNRGRSDGGGVGGVEAGLGVLSY